MDLDDSLDAVGPHLRSLRRDRDTTLADLSAETGISVSTLSRLESGDRKPTLELLLPLARSYGVTLDELVDAPPTGDPRIHLRPVEAHGMTMIPLTRQSGGIQAFKMVIPAGRGRRTPHLQTHEGYEWVYVMNGNLRLVLSPPGKGEHDLVLPPARPPSSTPAPRTGSVPRTTTRSSSSACSASTANGRTCGLGRRRVATADVG